MSRMSPAEYDPDKMSIYDIDPDDVEMLWAWMEHPNTDAITNDLGRQFRALPAAEQLPELEETLKKFTAWHDELVSAIGDDLPPEDPRLQLLLLMVRNMGVIERRIAELEDEERS